MNIDENIKKNIIEFNDKFSKYTSNYTLLVIKHIPNNQQSHLFTYKDNIHFLELHTLSLSSGIEFVNQSDNIYLDHIINSKYNFTVKNLEVKKKLWYKHKMNFTRNQM
jgi:hypothetical protein